MTVTAEVLPPMANTSMNKQIDTTVKLLVTLLAEPRIKAGQLAEAVGHSQNYVARMIGRFREAGLEIDYNFTKGQYEVRIGPQLEKAVLGRFASRLKRILSNSSANLKGATIHPFAQSRYTLPEFAQMFGTTPQNVYNMITGYKNAKLPASFVAYQMKDRGKWYVQKMSASRSGTEWTIPENVKSAFRVVVGEGPPAGKAEQVKRARCAVPKCKENILARGLCSGHYYQARRHPERFAKYID